ncbi:MAG: cyclase family protein [Nitrosopumilus sp. B06]|nr:MAG: cyclase family protein [Nitrosopumilus sp. D6]RNJ80042.1 MAG: cyclase family protein [Nitrosopumilus sp. B06]
MRLIDLTLPISASLPSFPGSPGPQFIPWSKLQEDGYNMELLFLSTHTGTHLDAPYHFAKDGIKIDQIPLGRLMGRASLLKLDIKANAQITKSDIVTFEKTGGRIRPGASIFLFTGWQKNLKKRNYFTENPGLSAPAARHLASRGINLVGTDSPSIDPGNAKSFPAHRILSGSGILIVENLANLDRIPSDTFDFTILPLKLKGATGSPVRAVATKR